MLNSALMRQTGTRGLMTTAEVAEELGIHKTTITRWVASGRLVPAVVVRGAFLFKRRDVTKLRAA